MTVGFIKLLRKCCAVYMPNDEEMWVTLTRKQQYCFTEGYQQDKDGANRCSLDGHGVGIAEVCTVTSLKKSRARAKEEYEKHDGALPDFPTSEECLRKEMETKRRLPGSFGIGLENVPGRGFADFDIESSSVSDGEKLGRQLVPVGDVFDLATAPQPLADANDDLNSENQTPHEELAAPAPAAETTTSSAPSGALLLHVAESIPSAQQTVLSDDGSFVQVAKRRRRTQSDLANSMAAITWSVQPSAHIWTDCNKSKHEKNYLHVAMDLHTNRQRTSAKEIVVKGINDHVGSNVGPPDSIRSSCKFLPEPKARRSSSASNARVIAATGEGIVAFFGCAASKS